MSDEVIQAQENLNSENTTDIIQKPLQGQITATDTQALPVSLKEKITSAISEIRRNKLRELVSLSCSIEEIYYDLIHVIKPETKYVAKIPKKFQAQMQNGILDFMKDSKTGESLGVLVNQKHRTAGIVRIEQESVSVRFAANIATIAIQQQLAYLTEAIDDVRSRVIALQEGHDKDLFGSIIGMHQQMVQLKDAVNPDTRRQLATNAITVLNETRGKIEVSIRSILDNMSFVPHGFLPIVWKILKDKHFLSRTDEQFNRIEELTSYYLTATQLLGYAYAFLDESASFEDIFAPSGVFFDTRKTEKLRLAEQLYMEPIEDAWYKNPDQYFSRLKDEVHTLFSSQDDFVELEVSGQELLEALQNDNREAEKNHQDGI